MKTRVHKAGFKLSTSRSRISASPNIRIGDSCATLNRNLNRPITKYGRASSSHLRLMTNSNDIGVLHSSDGFDVIWKRLGRVDVLLPKGLKLPLGIIHFVGGQAVGSIPKSTYGAFLEGISRAGFVIIATPFRINEFNHQILACDVTREFKICYNEIEALYGSTALRNVPLFGMGHSLGAKLQVLMNCFPEVRDVAGNRKANVLISFNNFSARDSIPLLSELQGLGMQMGGLNAGINAVRNAADVFGLGKLLPIAEKGLNLAAEWSSAAGLMPNEFIPCSQETWRLVEEEYGVKNNLVVKFRSDSLDESSRLAQTLFNRFGNGGNLQYSTLDGSHITPNTPDLREMNFDDWFRVARSGGSAAAAAVGVASSGVRSTSEVAVRELEDAIKTVVLYLRSQALWKRIEP